MSAVNRWWKRTSAWFRFSFNGGRIARFFGYAGKRFLDDGGMRQAAGLSYVSLLSLVPLLTVVLVILAAFPAFSDLRKGVLDLIIENMVPERGAQISAQLSVFVDNASETTGIGIAALTITAILLLSSISEAMNKIWRVPDSRPLATQILVYWAMLTLGPLLMGVSISISGFATSSVHFQQIDEITGGYVATQRLLAVMFAWAGFTVLYYLVPYRPILFRHALFGGVVAALLFEALKVGFGYYLKYFPSYDAVYGALSLLPILLVWLYLTWAVVLFGAQVTAALPEWRAAQARGRAAVGTGGQVALALSLLGRLLDASQSGSRTRERQLGRGLPATPAEIDFVLRRLRKSEFVARTLSGRWILSCDLHSLSLDELLKTLDLDIPPGEGWYPPAEVVVQNLADRVRPDLQKDVASLLLEAKAAREKLERENMERAKLEREKSLAEEAKRSKAGETEEEVLLSPESAVASKQESDRREEASRWRPGPSRGEYVAADSERDPGWRFEPKFSSGSRRDR
jgi:membrane protein